MDCVIQAALANLSNKPDRKQQNKKTAASPPNFAVFSEILDYLNALLKRARCWPIGGSFREFSNLQGTIVRYEFNQCLELERQGRHAEAHRLKCWYCEQIDFNADAFGQSDQRKIENSQLRHTIGDLVRHITKAMLAECLSNGTEVLGQSACKSLEDRILRQDFKDDEGGGVDSAEGILKRA